MRRFLAHLLVSALLWAAVVGGTYWWLLRALAAAPAPRPGETDGDSPGLPLGVVAVLTAGVLLVANLLVLAVRDRRAGHRTAG